MRRFFSNMWGFVNPKSSVHQVPYGRFVIVLQLFAALAFLGYTLTKKGIRLPGSESPYTIQVELDDAKGLDRVDEPGAAVGGAVLGRVTDVHYDSGHAVATLTLDADVRGKVFADASAELRPASAIQNLIVNVDPGTPAAGPLPDGEAIDQSRTSAFVAIDELTSVLDADTRAYVQILVAEAHRGLRGTEDELGDALLEVADLTETATPISRALAARRELLTRLVGELDTVFTTLGDRGVELGNAVAAGSDTLAITASRERELAAAVRQLGPTLAAADRSLDATADLAELLVPTLDRLIPATGDLGSSAERLGELIPVAGVFLERFDDLTRRGAEPSELLLQGTRNLSGKFGALIPTAKDLARLADTMAEFRNGAAQLADTLSGATSVNDNGGTYGQVDVLGFETPKAENFGLGAAAAKAGASGTSPLERKLALALERTCDENPVACILRFTLDGLPKQLVEPVAAKGGTP